MAERKTLKVELIRHTLRPEETIALGAKLCYSRATIDDMKQRIEEKDQARFVQKLLGMGHESVLEHACFTFGIEGVSRVLLAQLTRHRMASFSVQSQRYVSYENGIGYILPPRIEALGAEAVEEYHRQMAQMEAWYAQWQEKLGKTGEGTNEDARFVLPNATETRLLMTMNVRELRHFFSLRMCSRAQWEIREMARQMHLLCLQTAPALFADAGPGCLRGKCPEGEKSCGRMAEVRAERERLLQAVSEEREAEKNDA